MIERYSNQEIEAIWKEESKFHYWLKVELAVCEAWNRQGLISDQDLQILRQKVDFQPERIHEIERQVHHDMIAFLTNVRENTGPPGRYVHYGLTSSDVIDTALALQLKDSCKIIKERLNTLTQSAKEQSLRYKEQIMVGRTHGIHGEPTTLGLKLAYFYAELLRNQERLKRACEDISVGKLSGTVGTYSSITPQIEQEVCKKLELAPDPISTQVINRDRHAYFMAVLGVIAGGLERMAQEIRLLQKTEGREVEEPFETGQKGSSAMPHKRNPVLCERICGLARVVQANVQVAYRNMPLWHERDISHSSAERIILPDSIIALEYILTKMNYVLKNLHVYPENMQRVFETTRGLLFSQRLLLRLVKLGMERDDAYEFVQKACMVVWTDPTVSLESEIMKEPSISKLLDKKELEKIFNMGSYLRYIDYVFKRLGLEK